VFVIQHDMLDNSSNQRFCTLQAHSSDIIFDIDKFGGSSGSWLKIEFVREQVKATDLNAGTGTILFKSSIEYTS